MKEHVKNWTDKTYEGIETNRSGINLQASYKLDGLAKLHLRNLLVEWTNYLILQFTFYASICHMENCYNMMTIMNSIRTMNTTLSMLGFGGLFIAVFYLVYNEILRTVGYMTTNIL